MIRAAVQRVGVEEEPVTPNQISEQRADEAFSVSYGRASSDAELQTTNLDLPRDYFSRTVSASAARLAGRLSAMQVSKDEVENLLKERQKLLDKVLENSASNSEKKKLKYIEWSIDRVEDAQIGPHLDYLEDHANGLEGLLSYMDDLRKQLDANLTKKRK